MYYFSTSFTDVIELGHNKFNMGASSSLISKATPEQQSEINAELERLKGEGVSDEDIEKQLKEKFAELLNSNSVSCIVCFEYNTNSFSNFFFNSMHRRLRVTNV